jgi:hypothetical protein
MRPILGEMRVAMLPALDKRFTLYTLEMESAARSTLEPGVTRPCVTRN